MSTAPQSHLLLLLFVGLLSSGHLFRHSAAELGTASQYAPPYTPTACNGDGSGQFPSNNLFAAAGEGVWDNGAACGRQYLVSCINAAQPGTCREGTIQVVVVDRALTSVSRPSRDGTILVLSNTAYSTIANPTTPSINIDYIQA